MKVYFIYLRRFKMNDLLPQNKKIILFDGVCNLCNRTINKVIQYDKKDRFVFASLQSDIGKEICAYLGINTVKADSIILYEPTICYDIKSTAALKIINEFGGFWKVFQFFWVFPKPVRNLLYDFVAKNRYKWFGKRQYCRIPTAELQAKFLG